VSVEAATRGAIPIALEPGEGWRDIAADRLRELQRGSVVAADGEHIPLLDASVDIVVSMAVLEHVIDPHATIAEAFRVLKPGGYFYLMCENYLAFYEPHYQVKWFPLLPKPLGALYLKLRGVHDRFVVSGHDFTRSRLSVAPRNLRNVRSICSNGVR
jgi:SAM-dependent methyltransferase